MTENKVVVDIKAHTKKSKFDVDYITNAENKVIGVSHPDWPFTIMRNQDASMETAIVCNDTNEPFGVLDSDAFNTILMCWLLIDAPELMSESQEE